MGSLFLVTKNGSSVTYKQLIDDLNSCTHIPLYCYFSDTYDIFITLLSGIIHGIDLVLLDSDFSQSELQALEIDTARIDDYMHVSPKHIQSKVELVSLVRYAKDWRLSLYTSGTTGLPKKVTHRLENLIRLVRVSSKHTEDIWAFAYNPTHIAGIQVFFQAVLNGNTLVDVFGCSKDLVLERIEQHHISNISATPTFYRMLMPINSEYTSVRRITSGGERFDSQMSQSLLRAFPNAKLRNIYASTEAGSVLESNNDRFRISDPSKCKIENDRLHIHKSLLGIDGIADGWYDTGDLVEIVDSAAGEFIFISRASEMINVGGYKANPLEIEEALCLHPAITKAKVWGKENPVVGRILMADVVASTPCSEAEIRSFLKGRLQDFKIPRIISFVDNIETTRSGKVKRV